MLKQTKVKMLYLSQFANVGGGETALLYLLDKLDRKKFEPIVIVPQKGQFSQKLKKLKIKTYFSNLAPYTIRIFFVPGTSPAGIYRLFKLTRKIKPDLIHLNHLTLAVYAGICAKILKVPVIATAHGPWDSYYFYQDVITSLFVDKILANTPQTAKALTKKKIIKAQKVSTVPFGIDTNSFRPASERNKTKARELIGLPSNDLVITIVGRLDPIKDHLTFLKTAQIIHNQIPNTTFFIAGSKLGDFSKSQDSPISKIKEFLSDNAALRKKVVFGGFIDPVSPVYAATDILVSTSISESFGLVLAEASASGLPVVATSTGGQKLIVKDGKSGFLVPPQNPYFLAQKVLLLAQNATLRRQFGQNARKHIVKNFSIKKYVGAIQAHYLKLLKSRN